VNRTGNVGGSRLWKQGWSHGKQQPILKRINKPFVITYLTPAEFPKFVALEAGLMAVMSAILLALTGLVIRRRN
jgi:hypothetical protein